jgi:hypothetical protein
MISSKTFNNYSNATKALADRASNEVEAQTLELIERVGIENVSAIREGSKSIMNAVTQQYDNAAASLAAQFYDTQALGTNSKLSSAITETTYSEDLVDRVAHYQAQKLVDGDAEAFARACGELAQNSVKQSLNATILANCKRDEGKGVRYARVLVGHENCTFCIMLAGRGAVYHSRRKAGELNHYHRRCDCKIVPDFIGGDPMRTLVEGHDPWVEYRTWKRLENAETITKNLYQLKPAQITAKAEILDKELKEKWSEQKTANDYQGIYGEYLAEHGVTAEDYTHVLGKELQVGQWLAEQGFDVQFLHTKDNMHTPDILLNGEKWEIKRIEALRAGTMRARISDALEQSCNVIVDLSVNDVYNDLIVPAVKMLEDDRAENLLIISNGKLTKYKKA